MKIDKGKLFHKLHQLQKKFTEAKSILVTHHL